MTPQEMLQQALDAGLTFSQCVQAFGEKDNPYANYAREKLHKDGELEFDDHPVTSGSDDGGDYVMAWVWVSDESAGVCDELCDLCCRAVANIYRTTLDGRTCCGDCEAEADAIDQDILEAHEDE